MASLHDTAAECVLSMNAVCEIFYRGHEVRVGDAALDQTSTVVSGTFTPGATVGRQA